MYVDTSVLMGNTADYDDAAAGFAGLTYLVCSDSNNFFPDLDNTPRTGTASLPLETGCRVARTVSAHFSGSAGFFTAALLLLRSPAPRAARLLFPRKRAIIVCRPDLLLLSKQPDGCGRHARRA